MTHLAGKLALDIQAGAPNNGRGQDNVGTVKKMHVGRDTYPYIAPQAVRRWWRDSLPADEPVSPVIREGKGKKQQAYTKGRPDQFLDDDLFGYMVAISGSDSSCQRDTVLATGTFVSVTPQRIASDFGTMTRGFGADDNPVIHEHEFYTAVCAGDINLDLPRVGTFETDGQGIRIALPPQAAEEAVAAGATEATFRGVSALVLDIAERRRRVALVLRTLAALRGGAKPAAHYGDRTPALILLAPMKGGVNPFTRVLANKDAKPAFAADTLAEEIAAWHDELDGPVRIGWAPGFLGDQRDRARRDLADLITAGTVVIDHPRTILNSLAQEIENGTHDAWFEDVKA
ncbi:type I-B CRISPR-associated protein Cas7/Cst2/DevR [Streptomyces sp. TRM68367]|uniref:type I-B CRISPR-associated protein Cas7/Cst2/DevR n=1 Tax=Streptomyces sp. TRM68367 TaxID=2758415 RepID=UPI00165C90CF|nr:type I-B CRISPR-associated protein Cas7/Cst2/DevR [Streptomyces sp. TRM68367]MBC9728241.1 type I-B CRISPR-associated protein Cas7/Cst2/DevR [Streptomyces sp. TRM68367]